MSVIAIIVIVAFVYIGTWGIVAIGKQSDKKMHDASFEESNEKH